MLHQRGIPHDDGGHLTAGGITGGIELILAHALDEAGLNGPRHRGNGIGADAGGICKGLQIALCRGVDTGKLGIARKERDHLLAGDISSGANSVALTPLVTLF